MDILLRTAVKAALGLPPHASTQRLLQLGVHNTITELIEAQHNSQLQRLRQTRQGCAILSRLGYPIPQKPAQVPRYKLASTVRALIKVPPIPRNMNPSRHAGRRRARVQAMTRVFGDGTSDLQVLYTDAARYPEKSAMCLAVTDDTDALVASATLRTTDSGLAEEGALALAIVHATTLSHDSPVTIVTDSQAACRAFAQGLVAAHTHNILSSVSPSALRPVRIVWTPGHASLHGNERVHAVARELTGRAPLEELSNPDDASTEPLNYNATLQYYRQSRYTYPPPHPSLNRADAVAWRQLQTNSFPCLYMLNRFHPTLYPSYCPFCGSVPTVYHSTWECSAPQGVPPIPNPTPSSWESALLSLRRQEQQQLVQRARRVAQGNGALD